MKPGEKIIDDPLTWEDSFAISQALCKAHPGANLELVSLMTIYEWTLAIPHFDDDPQLANDRILTAIFQEWYEEVNRL